MDLLRGGEAVARVPMLEDETEKSRCILYTGDASIEIARILKLPKFSV